MLTLMSIKNNYDDFGIVLADGGEFDPARIGRYTDDAEVMAALPEADFYWH